MSEVATLTVKLEADARDFNSGIDQAKQKTSAFSSMASGAMMGVGIAAAGMAVSAAASFASFAGDGIGMASDLGETMSKVGVVFGDNAKAVKDWAKDAATALGTSQAEALGAAGTFGNLFVSMGMAEESSADMSMNLVELATDLASFNNIDPAVALEKLRAGMLGQSEPMQALGVNMTAAMVSAKAMEMGLAATTAELTPAMLAQARYALILEQTTTAQGDFARTSDGLANQQRIADAQWKELQTTLGAALLPVVLAITTALNTLLTNVLPPLSAFITGQVTPAFQTIAAVVGPAIEWITSLGSTMKLQTDGPLSYFSTWFTENMPRIRTIVENVVNALTTFWRNHGEKITAVVVPLLNWLTRFWETQMKTILDVVTAVLQLLSGDFEGAGETIRGIVSRWWEFFSTAFEAIRTTILAIDWAAVGRLVINTIWLGMQTTWTFIQNWAPQAWEQLKRDITNIDWGGLGRAIVDLWLAGLQAEWSMLSDWWNRAVQGLMDAVTGMDWGGVGEDMIDGIGSGIEIRQGSLADQAAQAAQDAYDAARAALGIQSPSKLMAKGVGVPMIQGIGVGFEDALAGVTAGISGNLRGMVGALSPATGASTAAITQHFYGAADGPTVSAASLSGVRAGLRASGAR